MMANSAAAAPEGKRYKYYGREYKMSVKDMAAFSKISLRLQKDVLKLRAMGYEDKIMQGWTVAQCFAHAGVGTKRKPAPTRESIDEFKTVIIYLRGQVHDSEDEIERLREMLLELGIDPDG